MTHMRWHIGICVALAALGCGRLEPLAGEATLQGQVVERDGTGVPNARVLLIDGQTASAEVLTDPSGHFVMSHLAAGAHSVLVLAGGERGTWRKSLELRAGGVTALDALELESVWAFPEVLWLRGVGFDEQWGRGADGLLLAGEGAEQGTLIATHTTSTTTELVQVERDGSLTVLYSTPWSAPQPDDAGFVTPAAPGATVRDERVLLEVPGRAPVLFDLRSKQVLSTLSRGSALLAGNAALTVRNDVDYALLRADGSELPLPELRDATPVGGEDGNTLFRAGSDGRVVQLTPGGLVLGDVVPEDVRWSVASPGFAGVQWQADRWSLLWLDPALHLHVVHDAVEQASSPQVISACGTTYKPRGFLMFGEPSTVWSVRDGQAVSTSFDSRSPFHACLAGERLVVLSSGTPASVASARLGEPLAISELPGDVFYTRLSTDGRVFLSRRTAPRVLLLEGGQPFASARPVGTVPYLYEPMLELRDGSHLFSGVDPLGGIGWFRVEVTP